MKYKNKYRYIPHFPNTKPWNNVLTHYDIIHNQLNEAYHVYNKDNKNYDQAIMSAILECIYGENLQTATMNNKTYVYTLIDCNFNNLIKDVYLYVSIENLEIDNINICYPNYDKPTYINGLFQSHMANIKIYDKHKKKDVLKKVEIFDKVSIICDWNLKAYNTDNHDVYLAYVRHELIHILHESRKKVINAYAGDANAYADELCNANNLEFPTWDILQNIDVNNIKDNELVLILSACIYYLDTSEYSAWLDTYYVQMSHVINRMRFINSINDYEYIMLQSYIYKIIKLINDTLTNKTYYEQICNKFNLKKSNMSSQIIIEFLHNIDSKYTKIELLLKHYLKKSNSFLRKCKQITIDKMGEVYNC